MSSSQPRDPHVSGHPESGDSSASSQIPIWMAYWQTLCWASSYFFNNMSLRDSYINLTLTHKSWLVQWLISKRTEKVWSSLESRACSLLFSECSAFLILVKVIESEDIIIQILPIANDLVQFGFLVSISKICSWISAMIEMLNIA